MKRILASLLFLVLLFGGLQTRAWAAVTPLGKTASGVPGENPNKNAIFSPLLTVELQRDAEVWGPGTVLDVEVGPNLYTYVRQNPWSGYDPDGLFVQAIAGIGTAVVGTAILAEITYRITHRGQESPVWNATGRAMTRALTGEGFRTGTYRNDSRNVRGFGSSTPVKPLTTPGTPSPPVSGTQTPGISTENSTPQMPGSGTDSTTVPNSTPGISIDNSQKEITTNSTNEGIPPLEYIHSDKQIKEGPESSWDHWNQQSTDDIIESLKPGNPDSLKTKPDGRIFDGNTRTKVLEERGYDINSLPRDDWDRMVSESEEEE